MGSTHLPNGHIMHDIFTVAHVYSTMDHGAFMCLPLKNLDSCAQMYRLKN